ncbi:hypothetical protein [Enterococcus hirae]|uniref:hypothetical protein n=1 Tax=Enterococcus hirae TaxID=1354 RepID=UPI0013787645|nr:hypothetical protein [Enterococcus hirae]EHA3993613.1 hypothetical protein [Enterococcus faecalis]NBA54928.1 hypothetical protein [Enterococcus hirae]
MTNEIFINQVQTVLENSDLTVNEREEIEKLITKLLENNTPEEVLKLLLEMVSPIKKG